MNPWLSIVGVGEDGLAGLSPAARALVDAAEVLIGQDVKEILECDLKLEELAIPDLREAIAHCEKVQDYISRELLEDILESEEEHVDWLETNLSLIDKMGLENFIQSQVKPGESS